MTTKRKAEKMTEKNESNWVEEVGAPAYASICEMVAALECDYDRLEELREQRADYESTDGTAWKDANADDADELEDLEAAAGECTSREDAEQRIMEDPLSLQFRSGWCASKDDMEPEEFELLLTTGGPAVRILGEIADGQAHRAWLEVQDWGKPWTQYYTPGISETLMKYVGCFCFDAG